jgi:aspartate racemase
MRRLGLIGGMSWESTLVYYRRLNQLTRERLGGLHSAELLVHSVDFAEIEAMQVANDWHAAGTRLAEAAQGLVCAGAQALLLCTNTMHKVADRISSAVDVPLIHIVDTTARSLQLAGVKRPLLLATRYTMEDTFVRGPLRQQHGIEAVVPAPAQRDTVNRVIFEELCLGRITDTARQSHLEIIADAERRMGVDGVILGCTEIGLLLGPDDVDLPVIDTTEVHVQAGLDFALGDRGSGK